MINFKKYNNIKDYAENYRYDEGNIDINRLTLIRNAITVGLGPKKIKDLNRDFLEWKVSNILTFIDSNKDYSFKNIDHLESTEKVTVAYYIGMVFAQLYMQKKHKTRFLLHLNSPGITVTNYPYKFLKPDFFGIDNKKNGYLIEAKGTLQRAGRFTTLDNIRKAVDQLESVFTVEYYSSGSYSIFSKRLPSDNFKKLVIATHPNLLNLGNTDIRQHIIEVHDDDVIVTLMKTANNGGPTGSNNDPSNPSNSTNFDGLNLTIDMDKSILNYYSVFIKLITSEDPNVIEVDGIPNATFRIVHLEKLNCSIGLLDPIFLSLVDTDTDGIYEIVNSKLDSLEVREDHLNNDSYSLGSDGIIVIDNELKVYKQV